LNFGITPIWFPSGSYEYVEQILRLARNEMKYRGHMPGHKKLYSEPVQIQTEQEKVEPMGLKKIFRDIINFFGF